MSRNAMAWALGALVVLALGLRWTGIDHGLPQQTEPDVFVVGQLEIARPGTIAGARRDDLDLNQAAASAYPALFAYLLSLWPRPAPLTGPAGLETELALASQPFLHARILAALLGTLIVPATYFLARRFASAPVAHSAAPKSAAGALFAAALCATSLLHVNFSQQGRPHVIVGSLAALAMLAALRAHERRRPRDDALAWLAAVAAVGSLHNGVFAALPLAAVQWYGTGSRVRRMLRAAAFAGSALLAGLLIFYPLGGTARSDALSESLVVTEHLTRIEGYDGTGFAQLVIGLLSYDPLLLVAALAGLVLLGFAALRRTEPRASRASAASAAIGASFVVPYVLVFGLYGGTSARYAIPLLPYLAVLAARSVQALLAAGERRPVARWAAFAYAALLLALPAFASAKLVSLRRAPDACQRAAAWLSANADRVAHTIYLSPGLDLPLAQTSDALETNVTNALGVLRSPWYNYQRSRAPEAGAGWRLLNMPFLDPAFRQEVARDPAAAMAGLHADFVLVALYADGPPSAMTRRLRAGLAGAGAQRVIVLAPFVEATADGELPRPLLYQQTRKPAGSALGAVFRAAMVGPAIEIWRM